MGIVATYVPELHRYMQTLLSDAHDLTTHCGRTTITAEDVRLAETLASHDGYGPRSLPTHDVLMDLARQINAVDLPPPSPAIGLHLPDPEHQLNARPYRVVVTHAAATGGDAAAEAPADGES